MHLCAGSRLSRVPAAQFGGDRIFWGGAGLLSTAPPPRSPQAVAMGEAPDRSRQILATTASALVLVAYPDRGPYTGHAFWWIPGGSWVDPE